MRWWIEGAQINWELGVAKLIGGYESPIMDNVYQARARTFPRAKEPLRFQAKDEQRVRRKPVQRNQAAASDK